ncbi:MAG TPA: nickel-dependent hydrogenase large subunit, partial [Vicinamibacterales bacterium]|nr:nickel-dependent hydrogenase large subunit [Vicinamibacterales bacterium]
TPYLLDARAVIFVDTVSSKGQPGEIRVYERDEKDQPGPYEASLVGNPVADAERPLELIRTVHSFDPCLACAIHTVDVEGTEIAKVKAL